MAGQLLPMLAAPGADLPPATLAKLRTAATQFEATTLGQLLQPMFDTIDTSKNLLSGGSAEQMWRPMIVTEMAKQIARAGGIGLAQPVLQSLIQAQESGGEVGRGRGPGGGGQPSARAAAAIQTSPTPGKETVAKETPDGGAR